LARSVGQDAPVLDAFETADAVLFIFFAGRGVTVLAEGVQPFAVFLGRKEVGTAVVLAAALDHVTLLARWLQVEAAKLAGAVQAREIGRAIVPGLAALPESAQSALLRLLLAGAGHESEDQKGRRDESSLYPHEPPPRESLTRTHSQNHQFNGVVGDRQERTTAGRAGVIPTRQRQRTGEGQDFTQSRRDGCPMAAERLRGRCQWAWGRSGGPPQPARGRSASARRRSYAKARRWPARKQTWSRAAGLRVRRCFPPVQR